MSIIHEALKKTQAKLQAQQPDAQEPGQKSIGMWILTTLLFLGLVSCTLIFFLMLNSKISGLIPPLPTPTSADKPQTGPTPVSVKKPKKQPPAAVSPSSSAEGLSLTGIMMMGEEPLALINNQIFKEGDYIGEKRVISIDRTKVEILDQGNIITLTTNASPAP